MTCRAISAGGALVTDSLGARRAIRFQPAGVFA